MGLHRALIASTALALLAAGCATPTAYQRARNGYGYEEQRIEADRYHVSFRGNSSTPRRTVENYLLYRAAEITLASGRDYFAMADRHTVTDAQYTQTVVGYGGHGYYGWGPMTSIGVTATTAESKEYAAEAEIVMFSGAKPAGDLQAFDARQVRDNLEAVIQRPQPPAAAPASTTPAY